MIKNFIIIILLFCAVISCGKKGDPKYKALNSSAIIQTIFIIKI